MPLKLVKPIEKEFVLEKTDKEFGIEGGHTTVRIRQASQGQCDARDVFRSDSTRIFDGNQLTVLQNFSSKRLHCREVELTLIACNIEDENGEPLFSFINGEVDPTTFEERWALLAPLVAEEIHEKVLEINPFWVESMEGV
jgi:hypothetical protein